MYISHFYFFIAEKTENQLTICLVYLLADDNGGNRPLIRRGFK